MKPPSTRTYEHTTIQCGLLNVPCDVYSGMDSKERITRKMFTGPDADHEVGYLLVDKVEQKEISRADVVKKVATEHGFVYVEDGEIERLFTVFPKTITVKSFHVLGDAGAVVKDKLYYLEPGKVSRKVGKKTVKSVDPTSQMALGLLLKAMQEEQVFALAEWTSRGTPKPVVLTPDGRLWTVHYDDDLREQRPVEIPDLPEEVVGQARTLVQAMKADTVPELTDTYSELIQSFADEKAAAGDFTKPAEVPSEGPVAAVDFLAQLTASVAQAKKAS